MKKKKLKTMNIILIVIAIFLLIFTGVMIWLFYEFQSVPDTLIISVFGACTGELSFCSMIRKNKDRLNGIGDDENG